MAVQDAQGSKVHFSFSEHGKAFAHWCCNCSVFFKGRSLSMQQQMMQQSRQLDPNLLMKQQTPPSQQQSLHQPSMKSFLENVMPHTTPELQKGPSPINAFSSFPIGGCPAVSPCLCDTQPHFALSPSWRVTVTLSVLPFLVQEVVLCGVTKELFPTSPHSQ